MTGGLMNLVAYGNENLLFNGNPKKTFFKAVYKKYTNFGLQRFRIDFEGSKILNEKTNTVLEFKIPRYAELLYDTYLVINLPNIYSPFYNFNAEENIEEKNGHNFVPYEFRWIEELGTNIIEEIQVFSAGTTLAQYSGEYLNCIKERDFSQSKKKLWNEMTGNVAELNDPSNAHGNINVYPNSYFSEAGLDIEPSIRGRKLYIPIEAFFCHTSKTALPLVALQYQEISIRIEFKPLMDLYTINNVNETPNQNGLSYRIRPNKNILDHELWRFLQAPYDEKASTKLYNKTISDWKSDIHLMGTYIFLGQDERRIMASEQHNLLITQLYTYNFLDVSGSQIVEIESKDMIKDYMFRFRRSDAYLRNEWSNYTNWPYNNVKPMQISLLNSTNFLNPARMFVTGNIGVKDPISGVISNDYPMNLRDILVDLGISMDGVYREKILDAGVYEYIEKYTRTTGGAKRGLYCYNFCLDSNRKEYQPSGAMNVNKFKNIAFEFNTIETPFTPEGSNVEFICDLNGNAIGFRKTSAILNEYNFDLRIFEERYNVLIIQGGRLGLMNAR
tara:strand:+ start:381 stop:2054 length:1674 start_codon:yes stop_codon:yes gene_type:complete